MENPKKTNKMSAKNDLLMGCLTKFYNKKENIEQLLPIIKGETKLSLRIIDWFLTNFSKKNTIWYNLEKTKSKGGDKYNEQFDVHTRYKQQLKAYSKKQFDPFCRRDRIQFNYDNDKYIITTVGQLNFFRWAIENNVLDYIKENLKEIDTDMNKNIKKTPKSPKKKGKKKTLKVGINDESSGGNLSKKPERKKRRELSISASKTLNRHKANIVLEFE